ncbi:MAG: hypothetical protein IPJ20_19380 [Flammeovirgaceae bacterium]|nr:hypothetical protein [Flammeovirgaceae bacterium]
MQFLDENYIIPSGKTHKWWANSVSMKYPAFRNMMKAKRQSLSVRIILNFANFINIPPKELIKRQNRFLLNQYLIKNKGQKSLKRVKQKVEHKLVKGILWNNFLRPMNISRQELSDQMKISGSDYDNF